MSECSLHCIWLIFFVLWCLLFLPLIKPFVLQSRSREVVVSLSLSPSEKLQANPQTWEIFTCILFHPGHMQDFITPPDPESTGMPPAGPGYLLLLLLSFSLSLQPEMPQSMTNFPCREALSPPSLRGCRWNTSLVFSCCAFPFSEPPFTLGFSKVLGVARTICSSWILF